MLTAITLPTFRRAIAARLGGFCWGHATALSTTTLADATSMNIINSGGRSSQLYVPGYLLRPETVTYADRVRTIKSVVQATGVITHGGGVYTDVTVGTEEYEIHPYLNPDDADNGLIGAINRGLEQCYYRARFPLTLLADGDMQSSGVTDWASVSNAGLTKDTTNVFYGQRAGLITTTAANGYVQQIVNCHPNEAYDIWMICRSDNTNTATPTLSLYSGTTLIDSWTYSEMGLASGDLQEEWVLIHGQAVTPSACRRLSVRVAVAENGGKLYVGALVLQRQRQKEYIGPSWLVEPWQVNNVMQVLGNVPRAFDYAGMETTVDFNPTAVSHAIIRTGRTASRMLMIDAWKPFTPFTTTTISETESVSGPDDWLYAAAEKEALKLIKDGAGIRSMPDAEKRWYEACESFHALSNIYMRRTPRPWRTPTFTEVG